MKRALVIGGAACVHADILAARALFDPELVIAVNNVGISYPYIDHWVSFHSNQFAGRLGKRRTLGLPDPKALWSHLVYQPPANMPITRIKGQHWGGSSGLLGVQVALQELECDLCVIAGIPMTVSQHFDRPQTATWTEAEKYHDQWRNKLLVIKDRVRSMSGWTRELLGAPTKEWLHVDTLVKG